ncbi:hypothetical protein PAMP_020170 [Pampus punctatissimus]
MDLPFEMDSCTISGSINDQPASTHNHDGLLVEECCQSVFAAPDSSTSDHESPPLKAGTSESESSEKLLSFHYGSDTKHPSSSDANDQHEDLFSNSGSGEEYQPSSTPSSSDSEEFSEKEKKSSRHTIPEKDHCHQSSSEHEELEVMDLRTKDTSPNPPEKRKGGKKGGKKQQDDERHDRPPTTGSRRGEEGQTSDADRPLEVTDDEEESQQQTPERPPVDWSNDERDGEEQPMMNTPPPIKRRKKTSTKQKHDEDSGDEEQSITATKSSAKKRKKTTATAERGKTGGKEQPMMNTPPPIKRRKKTSTKQKHDEDSEEEEQSITSTQSSAKEGQKTAAERGKTDAKVQVKRPWTNQERSAVQRGMAKFIALKKVPGKTDCLLCIGKESPVLRTRTWKDIKYFVYNEIVKIKRKLEF